MLRHLKRRQLELENLSEAAADVGGLRLPAGANGHAATAAATSMPLAATNGQALDMKRRLPHSQDEAKQKRVRGRRSSKPAMEKRRRARINECLDILKSYVLTDSTNLNRLGIDLNGGENQLDEESIARQILKASGLINRHRGRKNPNKLEKADILELTVDYVRRLHEQRDQLLSTGSGVSHGHQQAATFSSQMVAHHQYAGQKSLAGHGGSNYGQQVVVPAHLNEPLTLDLSPKSRQVNATTPPMLAAYHPPPNTPLTPPSSASSLQSSSDSLEPSFQHHHQHHQNQLQMHLLSQVLEGRYKINPEWVSVSQICDQ